MSSETEIRKRIQVLLSENGCTMWRNNTGSLLNSKGIPVKFGLCVGSSDLIGLSPVLITKDMVGKTLAVFTAIEIKTEHGKAATNKQKIFIQHVIDSGGIAGIATSDNEAVSLIKNMKW